jgi:hypothetical protein
MVIGGIANSIYGRPRQTFDIDIKIAIEETQLADPSISERIRRLKNAE